MIWWFVGGALVVGAGLWLIARRLEPQVLAIMRERLHAGDDDAR